jgi:hypothetical protein
VGDIFFLRGAIKLVELGDALMNLVEGPHCTIVDPRIDSDAHALRTKARSLVTRFEKLGRSRDTLMVAVSWLFTPPRHALRSSDCLTTTTTTATATAQIANKRIWEKTKPQPKNETKRNYRCLQPRLPLKLPQACSAKTE